MFRKYFLNCFLLTIPVLVWDLLFTEKLPAAYQPATFWKDIPWVLTFGENATRIILFLLMILMPISYGSNMRKIGWRLYIAGIILYFSSWVPLMYTSEYSWSTTLAGCMAPAYTPLIWLAGIGLIADRFYFKLGHTRWLFFSIAMLFLVLHNYHTYIVFARMHR